MRTLNLGILAHVDAGKTTLTEELLHTAGVIDTVGRVDAGTTQTDSMALERQRGITIRAAVVAFTVGDVTVNLIDTPGHPDFIAEVDRSLRVLDGAVLVVSAVEGVQPQTVILMRALRRLRVPTLIFVNKVDRSGADPARVVRQLEDRLTRHLVPMGVARDVGGRSASFSPYAFESDHEVEVLVDRLVDHDEDLLTAFVQAPRGGLSGGDVLTALATQTAATSVHPVFFGSAITGAGVPELMSSLTTLLPCSTGRLDGDASGRVFKVERGPGGQKLAYVRMFTGAVRVRDHLRYGDGQESTVTAIKVFQHGDRVAADAVRAGQIATLAGLTAVRVGDRVGDDPAQPLDTLFAPPALETAVVARDPARQGALHAALSELAESDPLIGLRQDDVRHELFVSLFGEVQKEVIEYTLATDFGLAIEFRDTTTICIERPIGRGAAVDEMGASSNPFLATLGLSVEPGPVGSGLQLDLAVDVHTVPLYVYNTVDAFRESMIDYLRDTLQQGLYGWPVHDCVITMTACDYDAPGTGAGDYRKLTPLVIMAALQQAGTVVCEPVQRFRLDAPTDTLSAALQLLGSHRARPEAPAVTGDWFSLEGHLPAAEVHSLRRSLSGRTHGEGVLEVQFDHYAPITGTPPTRPRTDDNPLSRKEYLLHVVRRV